jgi:hypothetical protein
VHVIVDSVVLALTISTLPATLNIAMAAIIDVSIVVPVVALCWKSNPGPSLARIWAREKDSRSYDLQSVNREECFL